MNDIPHYYIEKNGGFWIAVDDNDDVIGTIGLMNKYPYGVLKKFFVNPKFRGSKAGISGQLYEKLIEYAKKCGLKAILLDTPQACVRAHSFYDKKGFKKFSKENMPVKYDYPERNSDLFMLKLE